MNRVMLNVKEAANFVGVSTSTIYAMAKNKEIPCIKIRGRILFHRETLEYWLSRNSVIERE